MRPWLKLFRKLKTHPIMSDGNALHIFIYILVSVDEKSGEMTIGRFQASKALGIAPTTFCDVLKRLETKYKIISTDIRSKSVTSIRHKGHTTIRVLKWDKYQPLETNPSQASVVNPSHYKDIDILNNINTKHNTLLVNGKNKNNKKLTPEQLLISRKINSDPMLQKLFAGLPLPKDFNSEAEYIASLSMPEAMEYAKRKGELTYV